ncbi:MAG TPA: peptidylprolyl isomerase [bacterium]|nr:peptidylprolyl isomerase [bacterium]
MRQRYAIITVLALALVMLCLAGCERKEWEKTRRKKTVEGYQEYLQKYPQGEHAQRAWAGIDHLSFMDAYKQKTPEAYRRYLQDFPRGKKADKARANIKKLYRAKADQLTAGEMAAARVIVGTSLGSFTLSLDPVRAPATCRNLLYLAWIHFYIGLTVSPVIDGKIVQMGDPLGNGFGGPGYMITAEINENKQTRGAVSMWRLPVDPDTAGSQFFICLRDLPEMDGSYTVFGRVQSGMDVLDRIGNVETTGAKGSPAWKPLETIYIKKLEVSGIELNWDRVQVNQEEPENEESREDEK